MSDAFQVQNLYDNFSVAAAVTAIVEIVIGKYQVLIFFRLKDMFGYPDT